MVTPQLLALPSKLQHMKPDSKRELMHLLAGESKLIPISDTFQSVQIPS